MVNDWSNISNSHVSLGVEPPSPGNRLTSIRPGVQKILKLAVIYLASFAVLSALLAAVGFGPMGVGAGSSSLWPPSPTLRFIEDLDAGRQIWCLLRPIFFFLLLLLPEQRLANFFPLKGTLAAAFQSAVYGGFVPAGGLFATLTSMGMLGTLMPVLLGVAASMAVAVTAIAWRFMRSGLAED